MATDVDHIIPVEGPLDPLFWDETNWQSLCHPHHSRKTNAEDGGFGRRGVNCDGTARTKKETGGD